MKHGAVVPIDDQLYTKLVPLMDGWSQKKLALQTRITSNTLGQIRNRRKRRIRLSTLKVLAGKLGTTLAELGVRQDEAELRNAFNSTEGKVRRLVEKWGLSQPDFAKVSILELYRLHNSSEAKKLRKYIREDLRRFMASFKDGDAPLDTREDEKGAFLLDKFESVLNYFEMLGAFVRFGVVPREILLDMVHNSATKLWSVITQTDEHHPLRFDSTHIQKQLSKIRSKNRGEDYAGDVAFLALWVQDFRDEDLHFAYKKPHTGGQENKRIPKTG